MNWEAIGAVGEVGGAIAVVVTLLYLAKQIHHQSNTHAGSNELETARLFAEYFDFIASNPDLQQIWETALADPGSFDESEKPRLWWLMASSLQRMEGVFHQYRRGLISPETWLPFEDYAVVIIRSPLGEEWWTNGVSTFSSPFRDHLERLRTSGATTQWKIEDRLGSVRRSADS